MQDLEMRTELKINYNCLVERLEPWIMFWNQKWIDSWCFSFITKHYIIYQWNSILDCWFSMKIDISCLRWLSISKTTCESSNLCQPLFVLEFSHLKTAKTVLESQQNKLTCCKIISEQKFVGKFVRPFFFEMIFWIFCQGFIKWIILKMKTFTKKQKFRKLFQKNPGKTIFR